MKKETTAAAKAARREIAEAKANHVFYSSEMKAALVSAGYRVGGRKKTTK